MTNQNVMLKVVKHLYLGSNPCCPNEAVKMLHCVQHDHAAFAERTEVKIFVSPL
jgi:hypothetical protein